MVSKLDLQRKIEKLKSYLMISFDLFYIPPPKYHLLAHNQLINLFYNEVKNLTSIILDLLQRARVWVRFITMR